MMPRCSPRELQLSNDRLVVTVGSIAGCCADDRPVTLGIEYRVNGTHLRQSETILKELLQTGLTDASVKITSDHDGRRRPSHLPNRSQHVFRTDVTYPSVTSLAVAAVYTPMRVKLPEGASTGQMPQLRPSHIATAPLSGSLKIPGPTLLYAEESWLDHDALVVIELRRRAVARPRLDSARLVALLQAKRVCLQRILDVRNDMVALPRFLIERIPPIQIVGDDLDSRTPAAGGWGRHAAAGTSPTSLHALCPDVITASTKALTFVVRTSPIGIGTRRPTEATRLLTMLPDVVAVCAKAL